MSPRDITSAAVNRFVTFSEKSPIRGARAASRRRPAARRAHARGGDRGREREQIPVESSLRPACECAAARRRSSRSSATRAQLAQGRARPGELEEIEQDPVRARVERRRGLRLRPAEHEETGGRRAPIGGFAARTRSWKCTDVVSTFRAAEAKRPSTSARRARFKDDGGIITPAGRSASIAPSSKGVSPSRPVCPSRRPRRPRRPAPRRLARRPSRRTGAPTWFPPRIAAFRPSSRRPGSRAGPSAATARSPRAPLSPSPDRPSSTRAGPASQPPRARRGRARPAPPRPPRRAARPRRVSRSSRRARRSRPSPANPPSTSTPSPRAIALRELDRARATFSHARAWCRGATPTATPR